MKSDLFKKFKDVVVAMSAEGSQIFVEKLFFVNFDLILLLDCVNFFCLFRDKLSLFLLNVWKEFRLWEKISFECFILAFDFTWLFLQLVVSRL